MINCRFSARLPGSARRASLLGGAFLATACALLVYAPLTPRSAVAAAGQAPLPGDLALVPPDALGFAHIRLSALWDSGFGKRIRQQLTKELAEADQEAVKRLGIPLREIERATFIWRSLKDDHPLLIVTTIKPYDRQQILKATLPDAQEHRFKQAAYYTSKKSGRASLHFVNYRVYVYGMVEDIVQQLTHPPGTAARGPLSAALDLASQEHHVLAGATVPEDFILEIKDRLAGQPRNQSLDSVVMHSLRPLLEVRSAGATIDFGDQADVRAQLIFSSEAEAKEALWPAKDGLTLARLVMRSLVSPLGIETGEQDMVVLLKPLEAALRTAVVEQRGAAVLGAFQLSGDSAGLVKAYPAFVLASGLMNRRDDRMQTPNIVMPFDDKTNSANKLKQLAQAMRKYHDAHGSFPAAAIHGKDGKPLLSWRVAILPFIEQDRLYKQFKLDEPWDSSHNKALLKQMPRTFAAPIRAQAGQPFTTFYQVFTGKGSIFDGVKGRQLSEITFGTSSTLMIVEAKDPVPWTKPEDLPFDPKKSLPQLGGIFPDGFNVAMCNGAVRFLAKTIKEDALRALITRNGAG